MSITIFYFLLLIVQIVMLVKTIKKTNKKNWSLLLSTIISSIVLLIVFFTYSWVNMNYVGWNIIAYLIISIIAGALYLLMLIISIIIKVIKNKKNNVQKLEENESEKNSIKKGLIINILTIVITFLIALFIAGLTTPIGDKYKLVLLFDVMLIASETQFVSILLVLLYLCIARAGYKRIKHFDALNMYLLIPSFILLLSLCKATTGFAFTAGISYYTFRKNLFKNKRWSLSFLYVLMFSLYYGFFTVMGGHAEYTVSAAESTRVKMIQFGLFKFVSSRTSWDPVIAVVGHYIIVLLPAVLVFLFERPKKIFHIWAQNISDKGAVCESIIVVNVVLIFPSFLLNTVGEDTYTYFEYYAVFSALLFMLTMRTPEKIIAFASVCLHEKSKENYSRIFKLCTLCVYIVCCACVSIQLKNANLYSMVKQCCFSRLSYEDTLLANRIKKLCRVFHPSKFLADKNYIMLTEIRDYTKKNRNEYCVFLKDDYGLIKKYADYYSMYYPWYNPGFSYVIAYWSVPAYTGLPVINAMYFKDDVFFVGNDAEFGQIADSPDYGLPPRICGDKVTEENMLQVAAKQNKKYVIVVGKDCFEVVPVK